MSLEEKRRGTLWAVLVLYAKATVESTEQKARYVSRTARRIRDHHKAFLGMAIGGQAPKH